ncbi:hypothetical protein MPDQ_004003 [Monascus purpureus]|uniref:Uncharacterized protein n=1 Tax=Monascus purpureus TaxID=5098 RepID=A0A507QHX5_MONPU|nr:hypothetical protein MPDQ_004003 [Monascus purpureus]
MVQLPRPSTGGRVPLPPPPPPPQASGSRVSSYNYTDTSLDKYHDPSAISGSPSPYITVSRNDGSLQNASPGNPGQHVESPWDHNPLRPPAARRAASAGPVVSGTSSSRSSCQSWRGSPPLGGWAPGMPLPPPPPGPPPNVRSRSVGVPHDTSFGQHPQAQTIRSRRPPALGTDLGSIPPTPAGWVDEESVEASHKQGKQPSYENIAMASSNGASAPDGHDPSSTSHGLLGGRLLRSPALRDPSAKGIRERRIERRNRQSQSSADFNAASPNSNLWDHTSKPVTPSDLDLSGSSISPDTSRHLTSTRVTPHSGNSVGSDMQQASRSRPSSTSLFSTRSPHSTPRPVTSPVRIGLKYTQTPPFSPHGKQSPPSFPKDIAKTLLGKTLPTPPPNSTQGSRSASRFSTGEDLQTPHMNNMPDGVASMDSVLSQSDTSTRQASSLNSHASQDAEFMQNAEKRHRAFIEKELAAANESEALKIFSEFIITESQIRRERYAKIWDRSSLDLDEIRRQLFELPEDSSLEPEASQITPVPMTYPSSQNEASQSHVESSWTNNYRPSLSPIASLNTSNDEMSSRGRAPSRWWESTTSSSSIGQGRKVQRSKRELKYMGLPREQHQAMQWANVPKTEEEDAPPSFSGQSISCGPDQYPPEKVGLHEEPACQISNAQSLLRRGETTEKLDISRFITLPPPYPRHHPAVNNSHPDLVTYRNTVRFIGDLSEIKATKQKYQSHVERLHEEHQRRTKEGRRQFRSNLQSQIQQGSITFAEAAEAEAAIAIEEGKLEVELAHQELDAHQDLVLKPMHAVLVDRITKATSCIDELSSKLFDDAQHGTPDQTQEEGDEKPELLEKLTQLKWLFEVREQLYREIYNLMSDRNEKYRKVVSLPYLQKRDEEKMRETDSFFVQDALNRRAKYESQALSRLESFLDVIEGNVVRGVEVQLSAFWDIAPGLLALIQQIPDDLRGFQVQIPTNEYEENPSYHSHPLQYLHSLLSHAETSSYQYIESQINLLCLLHEVRSAVMRADSNLRETERIRQGIPEDIAHQEMQNSRAEEERLLTADLKDRVATVEGQWNDALGSQIRALQTRIKAQLIAEDGWDDMEHLDHA